MRWIIFAIVFFSQTSQAQTVEKFSLTNVIDEKTISLDDFNNHSGVVIIFISTKCPYDGYYMSRIKELAETYSGKTPILLINSIDEETVDQMKNFAIQHKITIPYLADIEQKVLANLKPRKNPECFLLKNVRGTFTVVYHGAIDDNAQTAAAVTHTYLKDAINRLLAGEKIEVPEVRPVGCSIRKN